MEIQIPDDDLKGFNPQASAKLGEATEEFVSDMITEANRIESGRNTTSGTPEITSSMVNDARVLIRRGLVQPRRNIGMKVLRVLSAVLALVAGFMYDTTRLQDGGYMLLFILVVTATILCVTISTIRE